MPQGHADATRPGTGLSPVHWQLPLELVQVLESQACIEAVAAEVIAARVVEAGLIELGLMPHGRCSVRTGLCGNGPAPLPFQQGDSAVMTP